MKEQDYQPKVCTFIFRERMIYLSPHALTFPKDVCSQKETHRAIDRLSNYVNAQGTFHIFERLE
jgi:hypothetical protein